MMKLTIEEENILAMFLDAANRQEMLEAMAGTKEHAEDEEAKALIKQCENKVILMTEDDFDKLIITAAEDLPEV
jgi:hypothetical protein